jgi:hypothetical protein
MRLGRNVGNGAKTRRFFGLIVGFLAIAGCARGAPDPFDDVPPLSDAGAVDATDLPADGGTPDARSRDSAADGTLNNDGSADARVDSLDASAEATGPTDAANEGAADAPFDAGCSTTGPNNACGLAPQCGCASGQTCTVVNSASGAVGCVTAGSGGLGAACLSSGNCEAGLTCAGGVCRPYCASPGSDCPGTELGECIQAVDRDGGATPNLRICLVNCDLATPSGRCGSGMRCTYFETDSVDCRVEGDGTQGDSCAGESDCASGYGCSPGLLRAVCERYCQVGGTSNCPSGTTCTPLLTPRRVGGVHFGTCI